MSKRSRNPTNKKDQSPQPARGPSRRLWLLLGLAACVAAIAGWQYWPRPLPPLPFRIEFEKLDPELADLMRAATEKVQRQPLDAKAWGRLGQLLMAHGLESNAHECFRRAEPLDPREVRWPYLCALTLLKEDVSAALPYLERAAKLCSADDQTCIVIHVQLGEAYVQLGNDSDAEAIFRAALRQRPQYARAHYDLGVLLANQGKFEESISELKQCLNNGAARKKATLKLASVIAKTGDLEGAKRTNAQAQQLPEDSAWTDPLIAEFVLLQTGRSGRTTEVNRLMGAGKVQEALAILRQAAIDHPDEGSLVALGTALANLGAFDQAATVFSEAAALQPDNIQSHFYLASIAYYQGEHLRLKERNVKAAQERYAHAVQEYDRTLKLKQDHGSAWYYKGLSLLQLERAPEAVAALEQAVEIRPELAEMHLSLAEALKVVGRDDEARRHAELAKRLQPASAPTPAGAEQKK